jgi:Helix-turn-helix domain
VKRLSDQTLYEILEVSVEAPPDEIERACARALALYGPGSLATYTLMSPDEATLLTNRIEEARTVLLDRDARVRYDERIGVRPRTTPVPQAPVPVAPVQGAGTPWPPPPAPATTPMPEAAVASSTAVLPGSPQPTPAPVLPALPLPQATPVPLPLVAPVASTPPPALPPPLAQASAPAGAAEPSAAPPPLQEPLPLLAGVVVAAEPATPASPGTAPLSPSPVGAGGPASPPIPLRLEVAAARDLVVPEGSPWTGDMLRQVREARGLTIRQISDRTRVIRHHIENIEREEYGPLPAPVYLRGILVNLARELRLDGQRVARSYLERMEAALAAGGRK